jgi:hypothetical protein
MSDRHDRREARVIPKSMLEHFRVDTTVNTVRAMAARVASLTGTTAEQVLEQALAEERQPRRTPRPRSLTRAPSDARP